MWFKISAPGVGQRHMRHMGHLDWARLKIILDSNKNELSLLIFLTHVQKVWNCSFTKLTECVFSIFRIEWNLHGGVGVIRVLPKIWNRWFQTLRKARLNLIQLRGNIFTVIPCTKLSTWRLLIVGCYYFFDNFFLCTPGPLIVRILGLEKIRIKWISH